MNKSLDCTLPGQTIVKYNSGTGQGQGQSKKSGVGNYVVQDEINPMHTVAIGLYIASSIY